VASHSKKPLVAAERIPLALKEMMRMGFVRREKEGHRVAESTPVAQRRRAVTALHATGLL